MALPEIKGFLETTFTDWKGKVAAVVFLPRCNFRCPYCHNHRIVTAPHEVPSWPWDEVEARLRGLGGWVDGVCVTGGEPTLHPGLPELLERFRAMGLAVKLDTNGSRPEAVEEVVRAGLVDLVAVDVKAPLEPVPYRRNTGPGSDPDRVEATLEFLGAADLPLELRTTVHPRLLSRDEVCRLGADLGRRVRGRAAPVRWVLQRCRTDEVLDPELQNHPPLTPEAFRKWEEAARREFRVASEGLRP
ncbi:anaerobic ribonucleoside-triphosphate reductase activating protein [Deferrisoma palaeochoriense]